MYEKMCVCAVETIEKILWSEGPKGSNIYKRSVNIQFVLDMLRRGTHIVRFYLLRIKRAFRIGKSLCTYRERRAEY